MQTKIFYCEILIDKKKENPILHKYNLLGVKITKLYILWYTLYISWYIIHIHVS